VLQDAPAQSHAGQRHRDGPFTEQQLFNALRYGLRPENTPDVAITSTTPGQGNFPKIPHYLAPPMPWPGWRHMPDADLRAIRAYLKRGLKPVVNKVPDSEGPPDFWASGMTPENIGKYPAPAFPTANETMPAAKDRARVLRGRQLVLDHDCAACHRGPSPDSKGWLAGITSPTQEFVLGPCFTDEKAPCFNGRPRNLTADKETGIGKFSDQQIFNALRYGLRPSGHAGRQDHVDEAGRWKLPERAAVSRPVHAVGGVALHVRRRTVVDHRVSETRQAGQQQGGGQQRRAGPLGKRGGNSRAVSGDAVSDGQRSAAEIATRANPSEASARYFLVVTRTTSDTIWPRTNANCF
jgi:hypothetical protein